MIEAILQELSLQGGKIGCCLADMIKHIQEEYDIPYDNEDIIALQKLEDYFEDGVFIEEIQKHIDNIFK